MNRFGIDKHKLDHHLDRVAQWQHGDKTKVFPIYVEISPVGQCNHRCTFCAVDYIGYVNRKLNTATLKTNIQNMALHGVRSIMYAGEGEPLLHPDLAEIVEWTDRNGIDVALTTNATALSSDFCNRALNHCTWIKVSCNAGDAKTYSLIHKTKQRDWDRVWENIERAVSLKKSNPKNKTTIGVQCVLLPDNASSLNSLAKKCRDTGVDYLVIKPYSQHLKSENARFASIKYGEVYDKYIDNLNMYSSSNFEVITRRKSMESWDEDDRKKEYGKCLSTPFFWAYIMATGDVYGCSAYLQDDRFKYGNLNEVLFSEIWLGDKRRKSIDYVLDELDISECRKNCRMHHCNKWLWDVSKEVEHKNFI
jgi:GTP 3',8-cyclase